MIQLIKHNRINYGAKRGERSLLLFAREGAMIIFVYVNILSWKWHGKSANRHRGRNGLAEIRRFVVYRPLQVSLFLCKALGVG